MSTLRVNNIESLNSGKIAVKGNVYTIDTVDDFLTVPTSIDTVIVTDNDRGGVFNRRAAEVGEDIAGNGGTIFFGGNATMFDRQYDGAVNVKWFGAKGDGTDDYFNLRKAINSATKEIILESGATYNVSFPLVLPSNKTLLSTGSSNCVINKTTNNGAHPEDAQTVEWNDVSTYNTGNIDAVVIIKIQGVGAYTYDSNLTNISLTSDTGTKTKYSVYAPRCAFLKHENVGCYNSEIGFFTNNTWKSKLTYLGNTSCDSMIRFEDDGKGNGTGTSCDIDIWHKGSGSAIYAYALVYSTINRIVLEGATFIDDAISLTNCYGMSIGSIGLEVCTISEVDKALIRIVSADCTILGTDINNLILGTQAKLFNISGAKVYSTCRAVTVDDSAAGAQSANITNGGLLNINTGDTSGRIYDSGREVTVSSDSEVFFTNLGVYFRRIDFARTYTKYGSGLRDFSGTSAAPTTGTWLKGDKFSQTVNIIAAQPTGWVQSIDGSPSFTQLGTYV